MLFLEMPFFSAFNPELEKLNSIGKIEPVLESAENVSRFLAMFWHQMIFNFG